MKYILALLAFVTNFAFSEWHEIVNNEFRALGDSKIFFSEIINKPNGNFYVEILFDYPTAQLNQYDLYYFSEITRNEYDCLNSKFRQISFTWYELSMGTGDILSEDDDAYQWKKSTITIIDSFLFKNVCTR